MSAFLNDIRILDLTRLFAGPFSGQILGDFGADVIRVERPGAGDGARLTLPRLRDQEGHLSDESASYLALNRNKRCITANIATPEGQKLVRDLAAKCDVVIENYKVGDLARYGLDYESIRAVNPAIIYCSITGFGQTGPDRDRPGTDPVFQARGGWAALTGHAEGEVNDGPLLTGVYVIDIFGGCFAAMAILAALRHRDRTGVGQQIDLALLDVAVAAASHTAEEYLVGQVQKPRLGPKIAGVVPGGVMRCADGHIVGMPGSDKQVAAFFNVLGVPDLIRDPRFSGMHQRIDNRAVLEPIVFDLVAKRHCDELVAALVAAEVPASRVNRFEEVFADEQLLAREMVVEVNHPVSGSAKLIANPIKFSATPIDTYRAPPMQGQHTEEVLGEVLGLGPEDIAGLRSAGAI